MKVQPSQNIPSQRYILGMIPITITFLWCFKRRKVHPVATEKKTLYEIVDDK